jgi:DNA relaxase NicK
MYNTTTGKTIDDLMLKVTVTQEVSDGCYADFYLENSGSVYLNGNYFYRYATGKVNYALGDMSFSGDDNNVSFKFDAYDNQKKVWGAFTGHK